VVKSPISTDDLASRIEQAADRLVRLEHVVDDDERAAKKTANAGRSENGSATVDPRTAARKALSEPLDFPPLAAATVPGDSVAIAVDETVPHVAGIVRGVIDVLESTGVLLDAISVVTTDARVCDLCREALGGAAGETVKFVVHDPDDPLDLCFLGLSSKQHQLRFNRTIYDAGLVLPIGCARLAGIGGGGGAFDCLYPRFSDTETIGRFRSPAGLDSADGQATALREIGEAGWMLGVPMAMLVVPGARGSIAEVVAGEPRAVVKRTQRLCQRQWSYRVAQRASLVVATVTGGPLEQTWDNVARALAAAQRLVDDDGAVAICTALDRPPGKSLSRLLGNDDLARVEHKAHNDHAPDSWAAWQLAQALNRGPVYFLSQLDDETVEDLGLAPVADVEELVRLASRHESCIVLDDSQYSLVTVNDED
jgi:nickel-dependent lactate racemase